MARPTTAERRPLDRTTVVSAATALADREGVEALTMRRLAEELGFKVMALYTHVSGKDELLTLMVDAVAAEITPPTEGLEPLQAVRAHAVATRAAFVRHPWAPAVWQQHLPGPARVDLMEELLELFAASRLDEEIAHHGFHAVTNHVLGYTLQDLAMTSGASDAADRDITDVAGDFLGGISAETHPHTVRHVHQHLSGHTSSSFELVLDLIIDGLQRLDERSPAGDA